MECAHWHEDLALPHKIPDHILCLCWAGYGNKHFIQGVEEKAGNP